MSDFFFPNLNPFKLMGKTLFDSFHIPPNQCASGRKDGKTDQDEEYPLKKRQEETKNSQPDEEPSNDQNSNLLKFIHSGLCLNIINEG